jgi:radical SAM protein with 4Fe4S-binding SPASM domain
MSIHKKLPEKFCSVPWLQVHTEPDGKIFPCCYYSHKSEHQLGNWNLNRISDTFQGEKWSALRKQFLDGESPAACSRCWREEDSGIVSMRQRFNSRYSNFPNYNHEQHYDKFKDIRQFGNEDGTVGDIKLATIDLIFNNLCNFKCRSCGPGCSTSWISDTIKLNGGAAEKLLTNSQITHMKDDLLDLIDMIDPSTEVHFSGGEPMMQQEHYEFLKLLIEKGETKVKIRYNTNLSVYQLKNYNAFELLQHFNNVFIIGSVDAMGEKGEYIRKGFNWERALEWVSICKSYLPNADYGISAVYSLFNAEAAIDLHRYICESELFTKATGEKFSFYLNVLHEPFYIRTTVLPPKYKEYITEKINNHLEWLENTQIKNYDYEVYISHWKNAIILMNSADDTKSIPDFYFNTKKLDEIRGEGFEQIFPELHEQMKTYA